MKKLILFFFLLTSCSLNNDGTYLNENLNFNYEELKYKKVSSKTAVQKLKKIIGNKPYYQIIRTFKHAPNDKISFEYAKSLYHEGLTEKTQEITEHLIEKVTLDWRTVYKSYYLLAKLNLEKKNYTNARKFNKLSLKAHPSYSLAIELQNKLKIYSKKS